MKYFSYIISAFFILAFSLSTNAALPKAPDFAFPDKVSRQADKDIDSALDSGNGTAVINALIRYGVAKSLIDDDNLQDIINRAEDIEANEKNPITKSLLNTLLAEIYYSAYISERYKYDERHIPLLPYPKNISEWSGEQFKHKINELNNNALYPSYELQNALISNYNSIITIDKSSLRFYPTLYDFTAYRAISHLSGINRANFKLSDKWLSQSSQFINMPVEYLPEELSSILSIYQGLEKFHHNDIGTKILTTLNRLDFVNRHIERAPESNPYITSLFDLFDKNCNDSDAGLILTALGSTELSFNDRTKYISIAGTFLEKHPDCIDCEYIRYVIENSLAPSVRIEAPSLTAPGHITVGKIIGENAQECELSLYRLKDSYDKDFWSTTDTANASLIFTKTILTRKKAPFEINREFQFKLPSYGRYAIVPTIKGIENGHQRTPIIVCSDMAISPISTLGFNELLVINPVSGKPVEGATVMAQLNHKNAPIGAKTDQNGIISFNRNDNNLKPYGSIYVFPTKGDDRFSPKQWINQASIPGKNQSCQILTDLPIYHPGDTINVVAIVYNQTIGTNSPAVNQNITLTFRDANYDVITTTNGTTDDWGRIEAKFAIPTTGMTGNFRIQIEGTGETSVMVSDYKMPTFEISAEKVDNISIKPAIFKGKVKTYAGFPLSDTKITLGLTNRNPWHWWIGGNDFETEFYNATTTTDSNGEFSFEIPQETLDNAPKPSGLFNATFTATNTAGETQRHSVTFVNRKQYMIQAHVLTSINALEPQTLDITVIGNDGSMADLDILCEIVNDTTTIATFDVKEDSAQSFSSIPSGRYIMRFSLADKSLECAPAQAETVIYRPNDRTSPVDSPLWVATSNITASHDGKSTILYAVPDNNTHVYYITSGYNGVTPQKGWLHPAQGMNRLEITVPEGEKKLQITMVAARNLRFEKCDVTVNTPKALDKLVVNIETFRDKVTPLAEETLTLSVKDNSGSPATTAIVLDMFNKALTQLEPHALKLNTWDIYSPSIDFRSPLNKSLTFSRAQYVKYVTPTSISQPKFNLYGYNFGKRIIHPLYATRKATAYGSVNYLSDDVAVATTEEAFSEPRENNAVNIVENEYGPNDDSFSYRESETPLAFFRPMLATDENGTLQFSYTVPNANATWILGVTTYNHEMLNSYITREQIASKPIMAQPNPPRFVRMGDQVIIPANVMNATDSIQVVTTRFELFNPSTGEILRHRVSIDTIANNSSTTVKIKFNTPFDATMIGYRIKSATQNWADGEQGIIPILESVEPVIESIPFYIAPDSTTFSMELPKPIPGGQSTLQFCENPTWYIVTALPGLRTKTDRTANSAAAAIFSAAVADGILKSNPTIKNAIHSWLHSDKSDSTLISMLERDQDLKIALLSATPWMLDARSDTERMNRFALLFNKNIINETYDSNIDALAKLQRHGGGWAWISEFETPSYATTLNILEMIGDLKKLGYLPNDSKLNSMIDNAVDYIDRETASRFKKEPKADYSLYTLIRDKFSDIRQSTAAKRVTNATIQYLIGNWKNLQVTDKAIAAIILNNHSYSATSRNIIESLNEYSQTSPERGMWWPQLDQTAYSRYSKIGATSIILEAYNSVIPGANEIDKIRQWIIIEKEAQDWKQGVITSQVISSFLASGSDWVRPAAGVSISINNEPINIHPTDQTLGYYREDITTKITDTSRIQIIKRGDYPSWGAVINQGRMTMNRIAPFSCEDLSIEKRLYRAIPSEDGIIWEETESYKVGDRLQINLLITVGREMDYVAIVDNRAACLEPVEQRPVPIISQGIYFYRENRDAVTNIFIDRLPKGVYQISYEMTVNNAGRYSAGTAQIQSQYAPSLTAHSAGEIITVKE